MMPRSSFQTQMHPADEDALALGRLAAGDMGALGELYDRHASAVLRFVRRTSSREDAEDVLQSTFLRLAASAVRFDSSRSSGRAWIFGVAAHVLRERRRAWARFSAALGRLVSDSSPAAPHAGASDASASVDVGRALDRLSDAKRVTFVLVEVEGFTCEEVAGMLGIPVGTVWTRLHHARKDLRGLLAREVES